ncbi:MAG: hypothetical protein H6932_08985 [Burkholderiaceae bacterium]|nr:hypothetical protein [Burkholderiaceae bacterium]
MTLHFVRRAPRGHVAGRRLPSLAVAALIALAPGWCAATAAPPPTAPSPASAASAAAGDAAAGAPAVNFAFWLPGDPVVPWADLGYADAPEDAPLQAPELRRETRTALFEPGNPAFLPAAEKALLDEAEALVKAGQGEQARARYEALFDQVGQGLAELGVTNLHLTGQAGLPRDVPLALQWLERTAQKSPPFYFHLGDILYRGRPGLAASPDAAARAWSRGVRRGCGRCATSLLDFWLGRRQGVTIGDADAFVYAVWAADVGSLQGLADLEKVVTTLAADGPRQLPAAVALAEKARALAGTLDHRFGGLAAATFATYRTGLVNARWADVLAMVERGDGAKALLRVLGVNRFTDRQFGPFLLQYHSEALASDALRQGVGDPAMQLMLQYGLGWGMLPLAPDAGISVARGAQVLTIQAGGKLAKGERFKREDLPTLVALTTRQGLPTAALQAEVARADQRAAAASALKAAQSCVSHTIYQAKDGTRDKARRDAIRSYKDTGSFITRCLTPLRTAAQLNPQDRQVQGWLQDIRDYTSLRDERIARFIAEQEALDRQRDADSRAAAAAAAREAARPTVGSLGSGSTSAPRARPCRWKTYSGYGGGRVCVPE